MTSITISNIPAEVLHALEEQAALNGHSTEAEVCRILEQAAQREARIKLGSMLVAIAREAGELTPIEAEAINQQRDKSPAEPLRFE